MPTLTYSPPSPTPANVLWGTGIMFTAPLASPGVGATLPSDANLGVASAWTALGWSYIGATEAGVTQTFNPSSTNINIEEQPTPVGVPISTATYQFTANLAEETLQHINLTWGNGGTIAVTAAGAGQPGKSVLTLSTNFQTLSVAVIGTNQQGYARVFSVPEVMSAGQVQTAFRRAAQERLYPLTLSAICPISQIQVIDLTAPATS